MIMVDMDTPFAVQVTVAVLQFLGIPPTAALGTNIKNRTRTGMEIPNVP